MTKRSYPWPNSYSFQLKSHIGILEVANGVNGKPYVNEIKDRTNALLAEGARKYYSNLTNQVPSKFKEEDKTDNKSQKSLTSFFQCKSQQAMKSPQKSHVNMCQCRALETLKCHFCSKSLCSECGQLCLTCNQNFCDSCSLNRYDFEYDAAICFGCMT